MGIGVLGEEGEGEGEAVVDVEAAEEAGEVGTEGGAADVEFGGDLLVVLFLQEQGEDAELFFSKRRGEWRRGRWE
jgi:hypothetical protein